MNNKEGKKTASLILSLLIVFFILMFSPAAFANSPTISTIKINGTNYSPGSINNSIIDKGTVNDLGLNIIVTFNGAPASEYKAGIEVKAPGFDSSLVQEITSATLQHNTILLPNKTYTISITIYQADTLDTLSSISFTYIIGDYDNIPPTITSRSPGIGEVLTSPPNSVEFEFDESVSIVKSGIYIKNKTTNAKVTAESNIVHSSNSNIIKINKSLDYSNTYTVVIEANSVKDSAGNSLPATSWDFSVAADPNAPPIISSRTPASGAAGVKINANVKITISKELDLPTVNASSISLKQGNTTVPVTIDRINQNGKGEIILTPTQNLNYNTVYTVEIVNNAIKDVNGKALAGATWNFTTEAGSLLTISSRYPQADAANVDVDDIISITFNNRLNSSTVSPSNIYLRRSGSTTNISAVLKYTDSTRTVTITPNSPLAYNADYIVYISNNLRDINGNNIITTNWAFKTKAEDALAIVDRIPKPNSTNNPVDGEITVKFSQPLQTSTVTSSNIYLRKSGSTRNISADLKYTNSTRIVTITPGTNLDYDTDYIVYLTNNIRDTNGNRLTATNWKFTTKEEDPVVIIERSPSANAKDVDVDTEISIRFSQNMNQSTLTTANIYLRKANSTRDIAAALSYNSSRRTVTLKLASPLDYNTEYTVYVTNKVRDTSGNSLTAVNWSFKTKETQPFEVIYTTPVNNTVNFKVDGSITVIFSGNLSQSTLNTANVYLRDNINNAYIPVTLTYTSADKKLIIKPQTKLNPNTTYTVYLTNGLKDDKGTSLKALNWRFTTETEPIRYGTASSPELKVASKYVNFTDVRPYVKNGRTFLPFRALFEAIDANVGFDFSNSKRLKVWGEKKGNKVELFIGDIKAYRNGSVLIMDVKPELVDGRTMIPVRFAAEALGMRVGWDDVTKTVIIE